jgi:hypothetical protein
MSVIIDVYPSGVNADHYEIREPMPCPAPEPTNLPVAEPPADGHLSLKCVCPGAQLRDADMGRRFSPMRAPSASDVVCKYGLTADPFNAADLKRIPPEFRGRISVRLGIRPGRQIAVGDRLVPVSSASLARSILDAGKSTSPSRARSE